MDLCICLYIREDSYILFLLIIYHIPLIEIVLAIKCHKCITIIFKKTKNSSKDFSTYSKIYNICGIAILYKI